jgi:hypothetical protein
VNEQELVWPNSYCDDRPGFLIRGYYRDESFTCRDCGVVEVWTATQQKWWYEVAKGESSPTPADAALVGRRNESAHLKLGKSIWEVLPRREGKAKTPAHPMATTYQVEFELLFRRG